MKQWIQNIWNAQRNAAEVGRLKASLRGADLAYLTQSRITKRLEFDRNAYSCLTATLAAEYYTEIGSPVAQDRIPDSIKEAHMLRGMATNWKNADDVRIGKPMWEKRQRMEAKAEKMQNHMVGVMAGTLDIPPVEPREKILDPKQTVPPIPAALWQAHRDDPQARAWLLRNWDRGAK